MIFSPVTAGEGPATLVMAGEGPPSTTSLCRAVQSRGCRSFARHDECGEVFARHEGSRPACLRNDENRWVRP
jgi:hypothetical protein